MAKELSVEDAEKKARELLDRRIASVRTLVTARQRLAELREQVADADREDVRLYNAALNDGWSPDELRKLGLSEPEKKARTRRRAAAKKTAADAPGVDHQEPAPVPAPEPS
ncbi:hypothetical protein [Georgenia daeguensis]|uniref:Uncharacterized protein n=1 Tax=Georgenia daeguensis TaxID=908355 RepID=A0ABP8EYI2_9MICO